MIDTKQTKRTRTEGPEGSESKFSCCNFENMAQMMRKFCGGKEGGFDCCAMMQKMSSTNRDQPDQK
ncbi:MAG: hypothetical protein PVH82_09895 [Desulfobacteraceae bacterium]